MTLNAESNQLGEPSSDHAYTFSGAIPESDQLASSALFSTRSNGGHIRSASMMSTSSTVSIPSRSSSVVMSPVGVPARSSSITASLNDLAGPGTAPDLADSIASLQLGNGDENSMANKKTPQPESRPFSSKAPPLTPKSPFRSPSYRRRPTPRSSAEGLSQDRLLLDMSEETDEIRQSIQSIHSHMFQIQEKRHSRGNSSSAADAVAQCTQGDVSISADLLDMALMQLDEKLEGVSRSMQQLEARISERCPPEEDVGDTSIVDKEMRAWKQRGRVNSTGSINSSNSFDDSISQAFAPALNVTSLKAKFDDVSAEWDAVQEDAEALKRELLDDKYLNVFQSVSEQAEGMMSSLDKAVALCRSFVTQLNQDQQAGLLSGLSAEEHFGYDLEAKDEELTALTKTFSVKTQHYVPACQQVFHSLDKSTTERQTSNGSVLRRLAHLKARWKMLRDTLAATEKDLKRAATLLERLRTGTSPAATGERMSISSNLASLEGRTPALSRSTLTSSRVASGPSKLSSSSSLGSNLSGTPPPPVRRVRRTSATAESLGMRTEPLSTPPRAIKAVEPPQTMPVGRHRPLGDSAVNIRTDTPQRNRATSQARLGKGAAETGVLGRSHRESVLDRPGGAVNRTASAANTPVRHGPSSYRSSWLSAANTPTSKTSHARSAQDLSSTQPFPSRDVEGDSSVEYLTSRPGSASGQYYRPPSAQGSVGELKTRRRESLIPRLSVSASDAGSRPGSAMSQVSTPVRYNGASRLTMQTPEPTIMARAQRLNMYARAPSVGAARTSGPVNTPSKRASRPPPTKHNPVLSSGRMTPLSAAALASVPMADPSASLKRASIPNLRAAQSGRTTPTMSDNGSGTWHGSASRVGSYRVGSGSVAGSNYGPTGAIEQYRPNPNDALDVEVGMICNALGIAVDRLDAPLPRGVRLEEGPGKDNRTRYELGGKEVMCRLLELHRPAGSAGARAGTKAKKILVRVNGGWQDLEQWLLGRLGAL